MDLNGTHVLVLHRLLAVVKGLQHPILAWTCLLSCAEEIVLKTSPLVIHLIAYQFSARTTLLGCHILYESRLCRIHLVGWGPALVWVVKATSGGVRSCGKVAVVLVLVSVYGTTSV